MKLARTLWVQIQMAQSKANGTRFILTKLRSGTDEQEGRRSVKNPRHVLAWWWATEANRLALNIRYGARELEISKGKTAVEIELALSVPVWCG
jgi:hypothetical protein